MPSATFQVLQHAEQRSTHGLFFFFKFTSLIYTQNRSILEVIYLVRPCYDPVGSGCCKVQLLMLKIVIRWNLDTAFGVT